MIKQHIGAACPNFLHGWITYKAENSFKFLSFDHFQDHMFVYSSQYFINL